MKLITIIIIIMMMILNILKHKVSSLVLNRIGLQLLLKHINRSLVLIFVGTEFHNFWAMTGIGPITIIYNFGIRKYTVRPDSDLNDDQSEKQEYA